MSPIEYTVLLLSIFVYRRLRNPHIFPFIPTCTLRKWAFQSILFQLYLKNIVKKRFFIDSLQILWLPMNCLKFQNRTYARVHELENVSVSPARALSRADIIPILICTQYFPFMDHQRNLSKIEYFPQLSQLDKAAAIYPRTDREQKKKQWAHINREG